MGGDIALVKLNSCQGRTPAGGAACEQLAVLQTLETDVCSQPAGVTFDVFFRAELPNVFASQRDPDIATARVYCSCASHRRRREVDLDPPFRTCPPCGSLWHWCAVNLLVADAAAQSNGLKSQITFAFERVRGMSFPADKGIKRLRTTQRIFTDFEPRSSGRHRCEERALPPGS